MIQIIVKAFILVKVANICTLVKYTAKWTRPIEVKLQLLNTWHKGDSLTSGEQILNISVGYNRNMAIQNLFVTIIGTIIIIYLTSIMIRDIKFISNR